MAIDVDARQLELLASGVRIMALRALGDLDAAADVAQETVARALNAIEKGQLANIGTLGAFVRGIAQHVITDVLRARAKMPEAGLSAALESPSAEPDPLEVLMGREVQARLASAWERLPDADRELLRLAFVEGLTSAELARRLSEPPSRIRKRKSRAMERLRQAMGEADESRSTVNADYSLSEPRAQSRARGT